MTDASARFRRCEDADEKFVRFAIGKAAFEPLAVANHRCYVHPIFLGVWFALSMAMVQYMNWWPNKGYSALRFLSPLPAFAATAVPLLFFVDWFNRNDFDDHAQGIIRRRDAIGFSKYYSNTPGSALWIMEYGKNFGDKKKSSKQANTEATIKHFYIDEPYRSTGIQEDLLAYAIRQAFETPSIETIKVEGSPLIPYVHRALLSTGFVEGHKDSVEGEKVDIA
ncbi:hypothetical protein F5887DRAFT_1070254 [Amanita rubescens]|nr:hypothetical protein F5887DRAFT_1070254 [Amanita rubescens]